MDVKFTFSTMKPLHGKWMIEAYKHMTLSMYTEI